MDIDAAGRASEVIEPSGSAGAKTTVGPIVAAGLSATVSGHGQRLVIIENHDPIGFDGCYCAPRDPTRLAAADQPGEDTGMPHRIGVVAQPDEQPTTANYQIRDSQYAPAVGEIPILAREGDIVNVSEMRAADSNDLAAEDITEPHDRTRESC